MTGKDGYDGNQDMALGIEEAYRVIRARVAAGGPAWRPKGEGGGQVAPPSQNRTGGPPAPVTVRLGSPPG